MGKDIAKSKLTFYFCDGGSCQKAGSENATRSARAHLRNKGIWDETHTIKTRCNGRCEDAPTWIVQNGDFWYKQVDQRKACQIIDSHWEENQPLKAELLYENGQEQVNSENERAPLSSPSFKLISDDSLGEVYKARGPHSDQYLYALFLYLKEFPGSVQLLLPDGETFLLSTLNKVDYTDKYSIQLSFGEPMKEVKFVIALVPQKESNLLKNERISVCEYFIQTETGEKRIRFNDKLGRLAAELLIDRNDSKTWEYCKKIQLNNAQHPIVEKCR